MCVCVCVCNADYPKREEEEDVAEADVMRAESSMHPNDKNPSNGGHDGGSVAVREVREEMAQAGERGRVGGGEQGRGSSKSRQSGCNEANTGEGGLWIDVTGSGSMPTPGLPSSQADSASSFAALAEGVGLNNCNEGFNSCTLHWADGDASNTESALSLDSRHRFDSTDSMGRGM